MIIAVGFADDLYAFKLVFDQLSGEIESFKNWQEKQLTFDDEEPIAELS
jgi:uncharacterized membrane protein YkvA (DUF1232 family)